MTKEEAMKLKAERTVKIGLRLKELRIKKGFSQAQLAEMLPNESKVSICRYEKGKRDIPDSKIDLLAEIFDVSPIYFLGFENVDNKTSEIRTPSNLVPMSEFKRGALVGDIACGSPTYHEECEEVLLPFNADLALYCRGDSMINVGINDGDIVYIKRLDGFDELINGRIAAVGIGDDYEYTLKRWFYSEDKQTLRLVPENDDYQAKTFKGDELSQIHLLGVAVGYTSIL